MRIAYLCFDAGIPVFGTKGASVHLREVVSALRGLGHELRVYSPSVRGDAAGEDAGVESDGVFHPLTLDGAAAEVARLVSRDVSRPEHLANEWNRLLYNQHARRVLELELHDWQPDFIYERYSLFGHAGVDLAGCLGLPLLLEVNAPLALEQEKYRRLVLRETAHSLEARVLQGADRLLVVSGALADYAAGLGVDRGRIHVLPNAVDPERFSPVVQPLDLGLAGRKVVGFAGSLKPWHDVDTLVEAVRRLHAADPLYHLVIVGDGPRFAELQKLQAPFLTLHGAVEHARVPALLAAMDAIVVPYAPDGDPYFSPLKLFEAMSMERPVVGAAVGQVAEILSHGVNGLLYRPGDAGALAATLAGLFQQRKRSAAMAARAREDVIASYSWSGNARRIDGIATDLLASRLAAHA